MRGFVTKHSETVILTRGDESLTLTVYPLPIGYHAWLLTQYPAPVTHITERGVKRSEPDKDHEAEWADLLGFMQLAKSLGPSVVDSTEPTTSAGRQAWHRYGESLRDEFIASGLTQGQLVHLLKRAIAVTNDSSVRDQEERRGN